MTQTPALRPGLCAGGRVPLWQFRCVIGRGLELSCCLRKTRELEEWLPTHKAPFQGRNLGVPPLEIGWRQVPRRPACNETEKRFHGISQIDRPETGWRLDAVRHEYSDSCASSFAKALDEAIKSLERDFEQVPPPVGLFKPAGEQQLHVEDEVAGESSEGVTTDVSCNMRNGLEEQIESFGFANVLDVALGILESEDLSDRNYDRERFIDADQDCRTLEWVLDHSGQCGSNTSSELASSEDVDELDLKHTD